MQLNTTSFSTTFTDLESMERPGEFLLGPDCTSESGESDLSCGRGVRQGSVMSVNRSVSYAVIACDGPPPRHCH